MKVDKFFFLQNKLQIIEIFDLLLFQNNGGLKCICAISTFEYYNFYKNMFEHDIHNYFQANFLPSLIMKFSYFVLNSP
jgi:hypothetical protein